MSKDGIISIDQLKMDAIWNWLRPTIFFAIRSFHRLASFYIGYSFLTLKQDIGNYLLGKKYFTDIVIKMKSIYILLEMRTQ